MLFACECRLVVLVRLSMQVMDWKDFSEMTYNVLRGR